MAEATQYWARMHPLGALRCRILQCLSADQPNLPAFFDPPIGEPLGASLHRHLLQLHEQFAHDHASRKIVASGLLTFGELQRVDEILEHLPEKRVITDHGAGWCALIACSAVATLLPMPPDCKDVSQWVEGSSASAAVKMWFAKHRLSLTWEPVTERFILPVS